MTQAEELGAGRQAYARKAWADAYRGLSSADAGGSLASEDLERLAIAAELIGRRDEALAARSRAHVEAVRTGDIARAVRCAIWLGLSLAQRGETAQAGGWISRASRLVEEAGYEGVERGYLLVPHALQSLLAGAPAEALPRFDEVAAIGDRHADPDLITLGRLGRGRSLIALGEVGRGIDLLDEAMVAVISGDASPIIAGIVYCSVIEACQSLFDLRRAQEWTTALSRWCESQPDLVLYRGECLVYRSELLRFHGSWQDAADEAQRAHAWLSGPPPEPAIGDALYQLGELHRVRGALEAAEGAYREASSWGRSPEPGFALLRLVQGDVAGAEAAIRGAMAEASDDPTRAKLLEPQVEIELAKGDLAAARDAALELARLAEAFDAALLRAMAIRADGAVRLAAGDAAGAIGVLRRAWEAWRDLDAPHEAARVRVRIGRARQELGDVDGGALEFDAAREVFQRLGAGPDLAWLEIESGSHQAWSVGRLSPRETEVLRLLAAGLTNRAIALDLTISERTVDRHVSNIYTKLDVATRAAATAWAYEHGVV